MGNDKNLLIFGARIRHLRKERNLSQEGLAELAHVHRNFIGFIERGERNIGLRTIIGLAQSFGLHPSALLAGCEFEALADMDLLDPLD